MTKVTIITGTPGTGKTTFAKKLAKETNAIYIDVNLLISSHNISEGYDKERNCEIINTDKLNKVLISIIKNSENNLIIDSHLSHHLPAKHVDECIVCKTSLKKLKSRLEKRNYPPEKVRENLDAEIFDVCLSEAKENNHKIRIIYT